MASSLQHVWAVLFKFGKREHLEQFRKDGLLFMRPLIEFAEMESEALATGSAVDPVRADLYEGADLILHPKDTEIVVEGPGPSDDRGRPQKMRVLISREDMAAHTSVSLNANSCNAYCMYATTEPKRVDERNFAFGDSAIIVLNTAEFLRRFAATADALGLKHQCGFIEYFPLDDFSGATGPFRKPSIFEYQREFRLIVRPGCDQPRHLAIGNLEDITSEILPLNEINTRFDFSPENARRAGLTW